MEIKRGVKIAPAAAELVSAARKNRSGEKTRQFRAETIFGRQKLLLFSEREDV